MSHLPSIAKVSIFSVLAILATSLLAAPAEPWGEFRLKPSNENCLGCHGIENFATTQQSNELNRHEIHSEAFLASSHAKLSCLDCHSEIQQVPHHTNRSAPIVNCLNCHQQTWDQAQITASTNHYPQLENVLAQINLYQDSVHAQSRQDNPEKANAYCSDCHDPHYLYPIDRANNSINRQQVPEICGQCHQEALAAYQRSIHGELVLNENNNDAAICTDCHSTHSIDQPAGNNTQLIIGQNCGNCHEESMASYVATYHGQVNTLGETQTAKCYDCHGSHEVRRPEDPLSKVHKDNVVETCNTCHVDGGEGFASFYPHGTMDNFDKYPEMYISYTFMIYLLIGVFSFFYLHSLLWFYAEWRDRRKAKQDRMINLDKINGKDEHHEPDPAVPEKHVRRFGPVWRLLHLALALGVMILVITGMALLFPDSAWAPYAIAAFGGVETAGGFHRVGGLMFATAFFSTLFYAIYFMLKNRKTWKPFGPNSFLPNLNDLWGVIGMFKWFFGIGPRPEFDRWAYWEKFDFWAPFWGLTVVGISGVMLWNPEMTSHFLPGWSFNVATIVHGEEAFLAAVFLFSVHYFNCHFRPDKFPQDICIFTGCVPLHEYKHEHRIDYERMKESGELEKYLVDPPSNAMKVSSLVLGAILILVGVVELVLVIGAFFKFF